MAKKRMATFAVALTVIGAIAIAAISLSVIAAHWEATKEVTIGSSE